MKQLKAINVISVLRVSLFLGAVVGFAWGLVLMGGSFYDHRFMEGIIYLFAGPVVYSLVGAVFNALMAWIYNKVAERLGGIEIEIE